MRLSEAFQIDDEEPKEKGHRFVIVCKKTKQSKRLVPFPAGLLPYLPKPATRTTLRQSRKLVQGID